MKYLLDTDIVIHHLRGKKRLEKKSVENGISISIITLAELYYGAEKSNKKEGAYAAIERFLQVFSVEIISLNIEILQIYATEKAKLELKGTRLDDFDLLIGSTAKNQQLILITGNRKHFERVEGLEIMSS